MRVKEKKKVNSIYLRAESNQAEFKFFSSILMSILRHLHNTDFRFHGRCMAVPQYDSNCIRKEGPEGSSFRKSGGRSSCWRRSYPKFNGFQEQIWLRLISQERRSGCLIKGAELSRHKNEVDPLQKLQPARQRVINIDQTYPLCLKLSAVFVSSWLH